MDALNTAPILLHFWGNRRRSCKVHCDDQRWADRKGLSYELDDETAHEIELQSRSNLQVVAHSWRMFAFGEEL